MSKVMRAIEAAVRSERARFGLSGMERLAPWEENKIIARTTTRFQDGGKKCKSCQYVDLVRGTQCVYNSRKQCRFCAFSDGCEDAAMNVPARSYAVVAAM